MTQTVGVQVLAISAKENRACKFGSTIFRDTLIENSISAIFRKNIQKYTG